MTDLRTAAQQALEALENCSSEYGHRCNRCDSEVDEGGKVASALRAALAQQDEPMREPDDGVCDGLRGGLCIHQDPNQCDRQRDCPASQQAEPVEPVAPVAQQAEPVHDRHGACPTHCCPVHGCKYMHDDCPVVSGAVQPVYPRNNGCESCADDALAQQDEPVEPVAWLIAQRDALLEALKGMRNKYGEYACSVCDQADAVIKAAEESK